MGNKILRISILPVILLAGLTLADFQQHGNGKDKGGRQGHGQGKGNENAGQNKGHQQSDNHPGNGNKGHEAGPDINPGRGNDNKNVHMDRGKAKGNNKEDNFHAKKGNSHREVINWRADKDLDWGFGNFPGRKHPKDFKKVTICHTTDNGYPVSISVSENALKAHLNHGDRIGSCRVDYGVWTPRYVRTRENVYNVYEQTWERVSYGEALLNYALQRLLGLRTDLDRVRPTLTVNEVQRREALIMDLQNNVNYLQTTVGTTRSALDGVNINIIF